MPETAPKIRDDLVISEIKQSDGSVNYVIKDPITGSYFQVREPEYFIIRNFDGRREYGEIVRQFKEKFNLDIDEPSLKGFSEHLQNLSFLDNELTRQELLRKQHDMVKRERSFLERVLFFRLKAIDPQRLFERLIKVTGFFFTNTYVVLASAAILAAFLISLYNTDEIGRGILSLWNLEGIILIYLSIFVVTTLHEFAHGLTCRHFGGEVREIGFLMIYFQPAFYCNVSDAWLFPEKRKRLWVSFSGAFFQVFIWAVAVLVWRITADDAYINKIALAVMTFSGLATLFNFNPLLRYDGYYLLSDYLEIPNLRIRAANYWKGLGERIFFGERGASSPYNKRERRIYFYYGIFSFIYIVFVLGYIFYIAGRFVVSEYGATGFIIFAVLLIFIFRNVIVGAARGTARFLKRGRALIITLLVIAILVVISIFVKIELRVKGEMVLQPMESLLVKYNSGGYAELIHYNADMKGSGNQREVSSFSGDYTISSLMPLVNLDDTVRRGETIAQLSNSETVRQIREYQARLQKAREELAVLKKGARQEEIEKAGNTVREYRAQLSNASQTLKRMNEMLEKGLISKQDWEKAYTDSVIWDSRVRIARNERDLLMAGARPEEIKAKEAEIEELQSQIDFHRGQMDQFEIKSPIDGYVISIDTGEVAMEIASLNTMNATITISERDLADIETGQEVKFKVRSYPERTFYGTVYRIDRKVVEDDEGHRVFKIACRVPNEAHLLSPGMTGVANVYCGKRTIEHLIYRKFFRTIRTEFWDWFDW